MVFYRQVFKFDIDDLRDRVAVFRVRAISEDPLLPSITPNISILPIRIKQEFVNASIYILLIDYEKFRGHKPISRLIIDTRAIWS